VLHIAPLSVFFKILKITNLMPKHVAPLDIESVYLIKTIVFNPTLIVLSHVEVKIRRYAPK
jgi:hypothetical protein